MGRLHALQASWAEVADGTLSSRPSTLSDRLPSEPRQDRDTIAVPIRGPLVPISLARSTILSTNRLPRTYPSALRLSDRAGAKSFGEARRIASPGGRKRGDAKKAAGNWTPLAMDQSPDGVTSCSGPTPKVSCPRLPPKDARTAWQAVSG